MTPNLKRLVGQPKKLCHTLDYILSTDHYTDANDYWTEYVALAKRMSRVAQALLIPNIVKVLPIMGITDPQVLFHFEDEKLILKKVDICLKTLVESYLLEDPSFKIYNLVYESEKITYNRHKKTYQICGSKKPKLSTSILVKRFLGHLGLESVTCSLDNGNRSAPIWNQSAKYKIGIPSSKRSFAILSCVYGEHHWGSFQIFAPKIGTFIESNLQVYKQDIIDEHYDKEGEGESLGSQDTLMGDVYTHTRGSSLRK